jgi:hypothetical protein
VTTIQGPQQRKPTQGPPQRYQIPLQLRYKATSNRGPVQGFGQTRMISSQDIIFTSGHGLEPGMETQIALVWPFLLDGRVPLQLVLDTTITDAQDGVAGARILAYDFRTAPRGNRVDRLHCEAAGGLLCASFRT